MVNLTAYMVATTAMVMGISALDVQSVQKVKSALEEASVIPKISSVVNEIHLEASTVANDVFPASASLVEQVRLDTASVVPEKLCPEKIHVAADNILEDILSDIGKFIDGIIHPELPSFNIEILSATAPAGAKPTNSGAFGFKAKRAIYDLDGEYNEPASDFAEGSNVYSAQDASASSQPAHSASVKAVLKAHRSELYSAASAASAAASSASAASPAITAAPAMLGSNMKVRRSVSDESESEASFTEDALFDFNIGDILASRVSKSLESALLEHKSEIDAARSELGGLLKSSIDFDALRSSIESKLSATAPLPLPTQI